MMHRSYRRTALALPLALLVGACATGDGNDADNELPEPDRSPAPAPTPAPDRPGQDPGQAAVAGISPRSGPAGTEVRIQGRGFRANQEVQVGFGPPDSEYQVIGSTTANAEGDVSTTADVPSWAEADRRYLFVLTTPTHDPKAMSEAFHVTSGGAMTRVEGEVTDEGVECLAIRSRDGTLYTLAGGDTEGLQTGERITVEGTVAEMSTCMQGITIAVESIRKH